MSDDAPPSTADDVIYFQNKFWARAILFERVKTANPAWADHQGLFNQVDEETIEAIVNGQSPEEFKPEEDIKPPSQKIEAEVTGERPPPPTNADGKTAAQLAKDADGVGQVAPVAPASAPAAPGSLPEMPAPPLPSPLPVAPKEEPQADYNKLKSIVEAAAQLAESSTETAKDLLDAHKLEGAFRVLHPEKVKKVYGEEEYNAEPGVGSVILEVEVYQNRLHIITTDGVMTFTGNNLRGTRDDD